MYANADRISGSYTGSTCSLRVGEYASAGIQSVTFYFYSRRGKMIAEGFGLMIAGMGVVFAFLTLMVLLMNGSAKFFETFSHWFEEEQQLSAPKKVVENPSEDDLTSVAIAIAAAKHCATS